MPTTLPRIEPQHGPTVVPRNCTPVGLTPAGQQLYVEKFKSAKAVPMIGDNGTRVWKRHPINGEPLYPMNKREDTIVERMFFFESQGNFNVEKHWYAPPTQAELDAAVREKRMAEVMEKFASTLVDSGKSPDELMRRLFEYGPVLTEQEFAEAETGVAATLAEPVAAVTGEPYPRKLAGVGRWELSDGTKMQGKRKEADEAEALIQQQRAVAQDAEAY